MNKVIYGLIFLCFFSGNVALAQNTSTDELVVPLSSPGKPYSLKVSLVDGEITVNSYAGKDIVIEVTTEKRKKGEITTDASTGMKRISSGNSFGISASEDNNNINVSSDNPEQKVSLSLKIPQDVKLKLGTVNGGDIVVNNIKGELEINNVNGAITLTNIEGSVVASTIDGKVTTTFKSVDEKAPMAFSSLDGDVDVTFPANIKYNLKMKSDHGEIFTDFDVDIDKTETKAQKSVSEGMYQLKQDDWINGKINGGGPEILMKNMDGNIFIRKAK
jgi:uncharacterized Zn finger protein